MSANILILEDNELFLETIEDFLQTQGFTTQRAINGEEALEICFKHKFDLYLIDVKVPLLNGFDFLKELRVSKDLTPAIFITSLNDKESLLKGFMSGCDDYMKKPLDLDELKWRIDAILKRVNTEEIIKIDDEFCFNVKRKRPYKNNKEIDLNPKDAKLLYLLLKDRGKVVTKEMIKDALWSSAETVNEGSVRVYINNLKKIFSKEAITNIRGVGYRFEDFV